MSNRLENNPTFEYDGSHEAPAISRINTVQLGQTAELSIETTAPSPAVKSTLGALTVSEAIDASPDASAQNVTPEAQETSEAPEVLDPRANLSPEKLTLLDEAFGADFDYKSFAVIHSMRELLSDAYYVHRKNENINNDSSAEDKDHNRSTKLFEQILTTGINTGYLLGNFPDEQGNQPFEVTAFDTIRYDDLRNRIDCGVVLKLPAEDLEGTALPEKICFGIDFTTAHNRAGLENKFTKSTNDWIVESTLPEGYSRIKYFDDGTEKSDRDVPRFVIALDGFENPDDIASLGPASMEYLIVRFKMLDQLNRQAKLRADKAEVRLGILENLPDTPEAEFNSVAQELDIYTELGDRFQTSLERTALSLTTTVREDPNHPGEYIHIPRSTSLGFKTATITREENSGTLSHREAADQRTFIVRRALSDYKRKKPDLAYRKFSDLLSREESAQARLRDLRASNITAAS